MKAGYALTRWVGLLVASAPLLANTPQAGESKTLRGGAYSLQAYATASGKQSSGVGLRLQTVLGQADAGRLVGGNFQLLGGLLTETRAQPTALFANGFE